MSGTAVGIERTPVVRAKLTAPSLPERWVERSRLDQRLAELTSRYSVVTVVATAGAGKTTAVTRAVTGIGLPTAWLRLDDSEAAAGRLLVYLEAALASRVAAADGVAMRAVASGIAHPEAAGLLAEAVAGEPVLLVLDNLERLVGSPEAGAVIEALVRYASPSTKVVLLSREELPFDLGPMVLSGQVGALREDELAFTVEEAAQALRLAGADGIDPDTAVAATRGWVAGVLFEAWRFHPEVPAIGGEGDPLQGYLSTSILAQLSDADREFLIGTALIDDVSAERAIRLGHVDAAARLASLRVRYLPLTWAGSPLVMRAHERFREYLLERLHRRSSSSVAEARAAYGRLLVAEGRDEEAVEELVAGGALDEAVSAAEAAIVAVVDRLDLDLAERWLGRLSRIRPEPSARLVTAELMICVVTDDWARGIALCDRLLHHGHRDAVARSSPRAGALMAWCYLHDGRADDIRSVLDVAAPTPETTAMRYCLTLIDDEVDRPSAVRPPLTGGPLDALITRVDYYRGALHHLTRGTDATGAPEHPPRSLLMHAIIGQRQIGALIALGRREEAAALYESTRRAHGNTWLSAVLGAELLYDLGRVDEAWAVFATSTAMLKRTGSRLQQALSGPVEAKLWLRCRRDPGRAQAVLNSMEAPSWVASYAFLREQAATWRGLALLFEGRDAEALALLAAATASLRSGHRDLYLPTAATYLAEAQWRAGDEEAADRSADLALGASNRLGSAHLLLQALRDFPAVAARRIDVEAAVDSEWHRLGRALRAGGVQLDGVLPAPIHVREFGGLGVQVDGEAVVLPLTKARLLLAYLATRPERRDRRARLVDALFASGTDDSANAYLRQAVHQVRSALPPGVSLLVDRGDVALVPAPALGSDSVRLTALLEEARGLSGREQFAALMRAIELADRGDYLPSVDLPWANRRRAELEDVLDDAVLEAGSLALRDGSYDVAEKLAARVLAHQPLREDAWQLRMRVYGMLGDYAAVASTYHDCRRALAEAGARPTETTTALLQNLRR
jgi:DNA-binding SARP family transcriptional activator